MKRKVFEESEEPRQGFRQFSLRATSLGEQIIAALQATKATF
jgi:hypothetical protein